MTISAPSFSLFEAALTPAERQWIARLDAPLAIQQFLDSIPYSAEPVYRCPLTVLRDRKAHCFDGAVFAAAMLARAGERPLIVDMLPENDDDHVLAVFQRQGCWGAIAKSNFVVLRYREPVYRSLRELIMSYFDVFYNLARQKTLRGYTLPLNLARFDRLHWLTEDAAMDKIADGLDTVRKIQVVAPSQIEALSLVEERLSQAGLVGSDPAGLYQPE